MIRTEDVYPLRVSNLWEKKTIVLLRGRAKLTGSYDLARSMWIYIPRKKSILSRLRKSHNIRNIAEGYYNFDIRKETKCVYRVNLHLFLFIAVSCWFSLFETFETLLLLIALAIDFAGNKIQVAVRSSGTDCGIIRRNKFNEDHRPTVRCNVESKTLLCSHVGSLYRSVRVVSSETSCGARDVQSVRELAYVTGNTGACNEL
ncbi:hypothetical protein ANN_01859 [Periplaneta americana]|uniref:Uncharacterized protein n=1 Tax=Periplaneta americana TaxID=6978 RepID=A0ABQ8TYU1_PERAM|nr:hypothetical protein ANN_01859 [Periplaneta americana]